MLTYKKINAQIDGNEILKDINLNFPKGQITSVIGQNGCGKSSLFKIIGKQLPISKGQLLFNGVEYKVRETICDDISILMQNNTYPGFMSVEQFLSYGVKSKHFFKIKTKDEDEALKWVIDICDLRNLKTRTLASLSGGQRQRVFIAMAIIKKPQLLILDEPTNHLDIKYQKEILLLMKKLNKQHKMTIIAVLHDLTQAFHVSDNIVILKEGQVVKTGTSKDLLCSDLLTASFATNITVHKDEVKICYNEIINNHG